MRRFDGQRSDAFRSVASTQNQQFSMLPNEPVLKACFRDDFDVSHLGLNAAKTRSTFTKQVVFEVNAQKKRAGAPVQQQLKYEISGVELGRTRP
jgi:hypothetical protein